MAQKTNPPNSSTNSSVSTDPSVVEFPARVYGGAVGVGLTSILTVASAIGYVLMAVNAQDGQLGLASGLWMALALVLTLAACLTGCSLTIVQPGQTRVLTFFGRYVGTVRRTGLSTIMPMTNHNKCTVRVRNFETGELKVNDAEGNPVNIAAIIVWRVIDTAKAHFTVDDYKEFVEMQAEAALRHIATAYPYDGPEGAGQPPTLRGATALVSAELATEVTERVDLAGVEVVEARISKLAYAPEIAQAMLQRQQADAIIAARQKIVEGAVGMVKDALARIDAEAVVQLDDERRAAMVSNLLVVLAGGGQANPVINTGSLYT